MRIASLLNSRKSLFYTGLAIKVILGMTLASHLLGDSFIPFIDYFIQSGLKNPYQYFVGMGKLDAFPYPAFMLYIMALPKFLLQWLNPAGLGFLDLFLHRLPLLLADLGIFLVLKSWIRKKPNHLMLFYWLSPVLIYISYIHGQLDVIPIFLLFSSLYFLFRMETLKTATLLGLALATKTSTILVLPFVALYLISQNISIRNILAFFLITLSTFVLVNAPYLMDQSFVQMVFFNKAQMKLLYSNVNFNGLTFFFIPAGLILLFIQALLIKRYNRDIFLMFLGFSFSVILLFIPPMQGWYYWIIPFLAYFYCKEEGKSPLLYLSLQAFYLLYFLLLKDSDYFGVFQIISREAANHLTFYAYLEALGLNAEMFLNLSFTALQTTLFINCLWVYKKGLESYKKHKITSSPFLIGVGGNSGVGKSTISDAIQTIFSAQNTLILRGDDMHKWQRGHNKWQEYTHLDPKANHLHKEIYYLKRLKANRKIYRRHYDHSTGKFTQDYVLKPRNITIFEGLHPFYLKGQRDLFDLKIFVKPDQDLALHWKVQRDMSKRGYSKEKVLEQIEKRNPDMLKYIQKQSEHADLIIETLPVKKIKNIGDSKETPELYYKINLQNSIYVDPVLKALAQISGLDLQHLYEENDKQVVILKGDVPSKTLESIVDRYIPGLQDIGVNVQHWPEGLFGTLLLVVVYCIFEEADNGSK